MKKVARKIKNVVSDSPFLHASVVMGVSSIARLVGSFLKNKVLAVLMGPFGVGMMGLGTQLQMLGLTWGSLSLGAGFTQKLSSSLNHEKARHTKEDLFSTTFSVLFIFNAILLVAGLASSSLLAKLIFGDIKYKNLVIPIVVSLPCYSLISTYFQGIFFSHGKYGKYSQCNGIAAVIETVLFIFGVYKYGIEGALWAVTGGIFLWFLLLWYFALELEPNSVLFRFKIKKDVVKDLVRSSIVMVAVSTMAYLFGILIRIFIMRHVSVEANGSYQAVCAITAIYSQFLTNGIWAQFFPLISREGLSSKVKNMWSESISLTLVFSAAAQIAILVVPNQLVNMLYSKEFTIVLSLIAIQLLGDFFFLMAQPTLGALLGLGHLRRYLKVWGAYYALFLSVALIMLPKFGLQGASYAYLIASVCLSAYTFYIFAVLQSSALQAKRVLVTAISCGSLLGLQIYFFTRHQEFEKVKIVDGDFYFRLSILFVMLVLSTRAVFRKRAIA